MQETITVTHSDDPAIIATFRRPTKAQYAEYWNALVAADGRHTYTARSNLAISCRDTPDAAMLRELFDGEWSALPEAIGLALFAMAGHFSDGAEIGRNQGERVDVRALMGRLDHLPTEQHAAASARAGVHMAGLLAAGATSAQISQWFGVARPHLTRACIALPWGGYYVGRVPTSGERANASRIHNQEPDDDVVGPYAAKVAMAVGCALFPSPELVAAMIEKYPGAGSKLGAVVEALGGGASVALGK